MLSTARSLFWVIVAFLSIFFLISNLNRSFSCLFKLAIAWSLYLSAICFVNKTVLTMKMLPIKNSRASRDLKVIDVGSEEPYEVALENCNLNYV